MEFETGRRSTLARLQLSVQGLAGSLNSAKKVLVASTVLTAAFCGAIFGLTLVANEASKESHVTNGLLTTVDGDVVKTQENKGMTYLSQLSAEEIAKKDFVSFSQDGADRYMQILGVQSTASKKVINTIVGAFEVTEEGMTFAGDNVVLEATEADKAARKAQCKFCSNGRDAKCAMCANGRSFAVAGRDPMCVICNNGRNFQCTVCNNGRNTKCVVCANGRNGQCKICSNAGRVSQCLVCTNGRNAQCSFCSNGRDAQKGDPDCGTAQEFWGAEGNTKPGATEAYVPLLALGAGGCAPGDDICNGSSSDFDVIDVDPRGGDINVTLAAAHSEGEETDLSHLGGDIHYCGFKGQDSNCYGAYEN